MATEVYDCGVWTAAGCAILSVWRVKNSFIFPPDVAILDLRTRFELQRAFPRHQLFVIEVGSARDF